MTTDPWSTDAAHGRLTEAECDVLAAAADQAMTDGWERVLASQPVPRDITDPSYFVVVDTSKPLPPYGSPQRARYDLADAGTVSGEEPAR